MKNLILFLLVFLALAVTAIVSTSLFLGVGYILANILPLSLFQGSLLAIGSSFVLVFSIAASSLGSHISRHGIFFSHKDMEEDIYEEDDDDDDDDEFDEDDENDKDDESERKTKFKVLRSPVNKVKIGRNDPCPCGSGLKYKRCCGK